MQFTVSRGLSNIVCVELLCREGHLLFQIWDHLVLNNFVPSLIHLSLAFLLLVPVSRSLLINHILSPLFDFTAIKRLIESFGLGLVKSKTKFSDGT